MRFQRSHFIEMDNIEICESEASETQYWLEVVVELKWLSWKKVKLALFTSIGKSK